MSQTIDVEVGPGAISPAALADIEKFERLLALLPGGRAGRGRASASSASTTASTASARAAPTRWCGSRSPTARCGPSSSRCWPTSSETYSRGWGHITTRQNVQFHFVQLERIPAVMRELASVGLTTREACGDTVRNVIGCHLAGACPFEVLDISPWAEATFRALAAQPLRPAPAPQVQDQLLGLRHRLRPGHVQRRRRGGRQPGPATTAPSSPASGSSSPAAWAPTPTRPRPSRSSPPARTCCPPSRPSCAPSTTTATATTSCGPA